MTIVQESLSFSDITELWFQEKPKNRNLTKKSDFCYILVNSAILGGFEFAKPKLHCTKMEYISVLYGNKNFDAIINSNTLHKQFHQVLFKNGLISSTEDNPSTQKQINLLGRVSIQRIYAKMAADIYISREDFHRWCRVALEAILYGMEVEKNTVQLNKPKFWGDSWEDALCDRFDFAEENKPYPLSEAAKFFLDPDLWDDYSKWVIDKTRQTGRFHANHYNLYVDAQEKLGEYLKTGKLLARGHLNKQPDMPPKLLLTDKFKDGLVELDYDGNKARLFGKSYVGVTVTKLAPTSVDIGNKKNTRTGKVIANEYSINMYHKILENADSYPQCFHKKGKPNLTAISKKILDSMRLDDSFKPSGPNVVEKDMRYTSAGSIYNAIYNYLLNSPKH